MNISYKRDMTHNYMVPDLTDGVCEDDYRIHMLTENHIRGLLPCSLKKINCRSHFFYDITSRQSMEHIYGNRYLNAADIRILLQGLYRALKEVKKYLLDVDRIVLQPDMIYMDIETKEPLFCYLPGYHGDLLQSFRELTAYLLEHLDQTDSSAVLLGYEIYRKARIENYSLEKLLQKAGREASGSQQYNTLEKYFDVQAEQSAAYCTEPPEEEGYYSQPPRYSAFDCTGAKASVVSSGTAEANQAVKRTAKPKKEKCDIKEPEKKPPEKAKASSRIFLIVCFGFAIFLALAAMWLWKLDTTQIGGIIFLLVGLLAYGLSLEGKKSKKAEKREDDALAKAMEDFQEEPYHEETPPPRENRYAKRSSAYEPASGYDVDSRYGAASKYDADFPYGAASKYDADFHRKAASSSDVKKSRLGDTGVLYEENGDYEPHLVLISMDPRQKNSIILEDDCYIIGKLSSQSDIVLEHSSVSRVHARIERYGKDYYLCDLNSTNGTFLNGKRLAIREPVKIQPNDEIAFARARYRVGIC